MYLKLFFSRQKSKTLNYMWQDDMKKGGRLLHTLINYFQLDQDERNVHGVTSIRASIVDALDMRDVITK